MMRHRKPVAAFAALISLATAAAATEPSSTEPPGEVTPHAYRPDKAWDCAEAHEAVGERMPGVTRTYLESRYERSGCREMLVRIEATTPGDAVGTGPCRRIGLRIADGEMPSEPREALARDYRRSCVQGATPRDWAGTSTLTPQ